MNNLDSADILLLGLTIQCLLFTVGLLFTKRGNALSNHILSFLLFTFTLHLTLSILGTWFYVSYLAYAIPFLFGPILFTYTQSIYRITIPWKYTCIHLLWPLVMVFITLIVQIDPLIISFIALGQFIYYLILSFYKLKKMNSVFNEVNTSIHQLNIQWIIEIFLCFLGLMVVNLRLEILHTNLQFQLLILVLFIAINFVGFRGILKPNFFLGISDDLKSYINDTKTKGSSIIPEAESLKIAASIEKYLIDTKAYTNPELNLLKLAQQTDLSPRTLSSAINSNFSKNFSEYINSHRLEYAKKLLEENTNQEMNVTEVFYTSGFNSKTRFYTTFKRVVGKTPKEFRENLNRKDANTKND